MVGGQLPFLSVLVPFWLVWTMSGVRGVREVWPAVLVSGGTFAAGQWFTSNFLGPQLPDIVSALVSLVALVAFLRFWRPKATFRFPGEATASRGRRLTRAAVLTAWSPFVVLTLLVGDWGVRPVRDLLDRVSVEFPFPLVHNGIARPGSGEAIAAVFRFKWLSTTGTAIFIAAMIAVVLTGVGVRRALRLLGTTLWSLRFPLTTIACVLGFAYVGNASGMTTTLGLALASTASLFPFFSPLLGWLGVFMTGSDTSANALFGWLHAVSAERLGVSPVLALAANSSGGVTGKMISPQSIAVACAATGLAGQEALLFAFTVWHSLVLVGIVGVLTALQASWLTWMVPALPSTTALSGTAAAAADRVFTAYLLLAATVLAVGALALFSRRVLASRGADAADAR
jgi:lactate permease